MLRMNMDMHVNNISRNEYYNFIKRDIFLKILFTYF